MSISFIAVSQNSAWYIVGNLLFVEEKQRQRERGKGGREEEGKRREKEGDGRTEAKKGGISQTSNILLIVVEDQQHGRRICYFSK